MNPTDADLQSFAKGYDAARKLYEEDKLQECIDATQELLGEPELPRYIRIKSLLMLSACAGDWYDAKAIFDEAEDLWQRVRLWEPKDEDPHLEESLQELRKDLDGLLKQLIEEQPEADHRVDEEYDAEEVEEVEQEDAPEKKHDIPLPKIEVTAEEDKKDIKFEAKEEEEDVKGEELLGHERKLALRPRGR